jgi:hypothetical protein
MAFNYPNHPLFRITPLLNDGQNRVNHDEYTSRLVGRIRAGRYMPELFDCNSLYLGYAERVGSPAYPPSLAVPSRYKMTMQEIRDYQNTPEAKAERARLAEERRARKERIIAEETAVAPRPREQAEERERFEQEYEAAKARRQAEKEQHDRDWLMVGAETQQWLTERTWIMGGPWECTRCVRPAQISVEPAGRYAISCRDCGRRTVADHVTLVNVLNAHKARLEPANPG